MAKGFVCNSTGLASLHCSQPIYFNLSPSDSTLAYLQMPRRREGEEKRLLQELAVGLQGAVTGRI